MTNMEKLLKHHQYQSEAYAMKDNLNCLMIQDMDKDFFNSLTNERLVEILNQEPCATTEQDYEQLVECYNEEWVLKYLNNCGVKAEKIPETNEHNTPDFKCSIKVNNEEKEFYVELKTLNICGGNYAHNANNETSLDAAIETEEYFRIHPQEKIHIGINFPENFDSKLKDNNDIATLTEIIIDKMEQNIKLKQFVQNPTFLFVMLDRLAPGIGSKEDLLSYYFDKRSKSIVSGILWASCFAEIGHLILRQAEFGGATNIQRPLQKQGILNQEKYKENIAGVLFGCSFFKQNKKIYGLYDGLYEVEDKWSNLDTEAVFEKITDEYSNRKNEILAYKLHDKLREF